MTDVAVEGLFILRKRIGSEIKSSLPNPFIVFKVSFCAAESFCITLSSASCGKGEVVVFSAAFSLCVFRLVLRARVPRACWRLHGLQKSDV